MSSEYGPFDRFVELGVLVFVAYEVIAGILHRRKDSKRQGGLNNKVIALAGMIDQGRRLQKSAPQSGLGAEVIAAWVMSVHNWSKDTEAFLNNCSVHASAKFLDETNIPNATWPGLAQEVWIWQSLLNRKLSNLQTIIQNAPDYLL
jgi:hypothetical protein